ncbi:MAG: aminotransferase class V-fold PLP-dependent enzyme [Gemmatimonadetes bacterium]|nr:aminotransferase class V-fold PLP-dependent enzyme [Gemmatimonadota bacterium]MDA1104517.1 aminotransferase class V-fold PLP-dependent enzyme [Gemmatimonadota bacterium]
MTHATYDLDAVRRRIPILRTHIPMNNCSQAPQSEATRAAADAYLASWDQAGMDWDSWIGETEAARAEFAAFVGAEADDVAVATSVSQATASVASGMDWTGSRRRVVASGGEFPAVGHVWLAQERFGAEVAWVPVRDGAILVEDYASLVDEQTAVVSACRGYYQSGFKQDIAAIAQIAHAKGALLYVDAYQTLGSEPFDAPSSGADFVASGNLKFLMGIPGIAFLWVRPGLAKRLRPAITGWFGREDPYAFDATRLDWGSGARRLDTGTPPIMEAYVARAGMAWLREVGLDAIGAWTSTLGQRCVEGAIERGMRVLGPTDPARRAPTCAILCDDSHAVEATLRRENIIASARGPVIRLAPHFYNTLDDVDQALDALAAAMRKTT